MDKTRFETDPGHDGGLARDLLALQAQLRSRRRMLGYLLTGGAAALAAGCGGGDDAAAASTGSTSTTTTTTTTTTGTTTTTTTGASTSGSCTAFASETNGPYPADGSNSVNGSVANALILGGIFRSDIRGSFGGPLGVAAGVPLTLTLTLVNTNSSCAVLSDYAVYLWHCDAAGLYSMYSSSVQNQNYLRGVQTSDRNGQLTFQTIVPGCYAGRFPHMHFEVYPNLSLATGYANRVLTSQIAIPRDVCTTVYTGNTTYGNSLSNLGNLTIASDGIFGDNTAAQMTTMTAQLSGSVSAGYTASVTVGLAA